MPDDAADLTRRRLLLGAAGMGAAAALPVCAGDSRSLHWDEETDVVVVGTGAAGSAAAVFARQAGAAVLMVEKADYYGGTTAKSQGGYWIPNNSLMRGRGLADPRDAALRYMARLAHPESYDPAAADAGSGGARLRADRDLLRPRGAGGRARWTPRRAAHRRSSPAARAYQYMPDYYAHLPENAAPFGRILSPRMPTARPDSASRSRASSRRP